MSVPRFSPAGYDPSELDTQISARDTILQLEIPWNNLVQLGIIQERELHLIKKYDKRKIDVKTALVQQDPVEYANLFLSLIGGGQQVATKIERIQYGLSLIDELLSADESFVKIFLRFEDPYTPFIRVLAKNDEYSSSKATAILSLLLIKSDGPVSIVQDLLRWCSERLRSGHEELNAALVTLQTLLRKEKYRIIFYEEDGLNRLGGLIRSSNSNSQSLYKALTCLWLLSYTDQIAVVFHNTTVVQKIVDVLRNVQKEKVIRVSLAILKNLANKGKNNQEMVDYQLFRILANLNQKKWGDEDLQEDLEFLINVLDEELAVLSSFDMYKSEVRSGNLDWTPVHKSEKFWRENIHKFDENQYEIVGILLQLLKSAPSTLVLSVACHDIGEFIRVHPRGRDIVTTLDGKYTIMQLMEHQDPEVQKQALLCTQKLMVVNWEYLR